MTPVIAVIASYLFYKCLVYLFDQDGTGRRVRTRSTVNKCPICLEEDARLAVETNCRHVCCSNCLLGVWRHSNDQLASKCPICRQIVTLMLPYFTPEETNPTEATKGIARTRMLVEIATYNMLYSNPRSMVQHMSDLPRIRDRIVFLSAMQVLHLLYFTPEMAVVFLLLIFLEIEQDTFINSFQPVWCTLHNYYTGIQAFLHGLFLYYLLFVVIPCNFYTIPIPANFTYVCFLLLSASYFLLYATALLLFSTERYGYFIVLHGTWWTNIVETLRWTNIVKTFWSGQ